MNSHVGHNAFLNAVLRQDFLAFVRKTFHTLSPGQIFVPSWHTRALAYQLERVRRGEIKRLIINMPPRSLKSITASVAFPAFLLGHDPTRRIICASYSGELAHKLSNDFRAVLGCSWYRTIFPGTRIGPFKDSETEIELTRRGFRLATSVGGTLTGRGGDIIVIDDPLKPIDALSEVKRNGANEWFSNTVVSRLDDKRTGAIVIVMQRVHMDDLTGSLLRQSEEWTVVSLPAIAENFETIPLTMGEVHHRQPGEVLSPEREPREALEQLRLQLGSDLFSAQYQQAPVPPGGAMIKRHWIQRYSDLPAGSPGHSSCRAGIRQRRAAQTMIGRSAPLGCRPMTANGTCLTSGADALTTRLSNQKSRNSPSNGTPIRSWSKRPEPPSVCFRNSATGCRELPASSQSATRQRACPLHPRSSKRVRCISPSARPGFRNSRRSYSRSRAAGTTIRSIQSAKRSITTIHFGSGRSSDRAGTHWRRRPPNGQALAGATGWVIECKLCAERTGCRQWPCALATTEPPAPSGQNTLPHYLI